MDKHYYLVAQLPMLFFDREPGIDRARFLAEAEKWLSPAEFALLTRVDAARTAAAAQDPPSLRRYQEFERHLRQELALWRATRGTEQEHRPAGIPLAWLREGTPLDVEVRLLRWRWDFLEEEERDHHFDLELVILYYLKLQLLERLRRFDAEAGLQVFRQLCEAEAWG